MSNAPTRTQMSREVTFTTVKSAKVVTENGVPSLQPIEDLVLHGNKTVEQAQRIINKEHGYDAKIQVFEVQAETKHYRMDVLKFVELAEEFTPNAKDKEETGEQA